VIIMARGKTRIVKHRRRRKGETDYRLRFSVLKSGKPRLVIRKSSNNTTCQIIKYDSNGDKVIASADSRNLKGFGWTGHCGNVPAAYLTGMLCGTAAKKANVNKAVTDIGLYTSVKGSRLYSALKGVNDAGIQVPHSEEVLPQKERLEGKHTTNSEKAAKEFSAAKENIISGKPVKKAETKTTAKKETKPKTDKNKRPI